MIDVSRKLYVLIAAKKFDDFRATLHVDQLKEFNSMFNTLLHNYNLTCYIDSNKSLYNQLLSNLNQIVYQVTENPLVEWLLNLKL